MTAAAVAVVRAAALRHNLQQVRRWAPGCPVLAVIKANAYGHGLVAVARILAEADGFAVARLEEAAQLREAGIANRIVVLGGFVGIEEARMTAALGLDTVIHSAAQVEVLEQLPDPVTADLWLKIDTGMSRLGVEPGDLAEILGRLRVCQAGRGSLRLMTHLASADDTGDPATADQLRAFGEVTRQWTGDISIANSAAILQWPASTASGSGGRNWVRPGLALYGASPLPGRSATELGLQAAMSFETRLIAVKRLPRGRRVGYSGAWRAGRDTILGVAAAGYADGYPWHVAEATPVIVHGRRVPVVGRVSMDLICVDLTELPEARPGDRVVLWGDDPPVEEVAQCAGTISYELLAGMSPRVVREVEINPGRNPS